MTVQELIDLLTNVEDKSLQVFIPTIGKLGPLNCIHKSKHVNLSKEVIGNYCVLYPENYLNKSVLIAEDISSDEIPITVKVLEKLGFVKAKYDYQYSIETPIGKFNAILIEGIWHFALEKDKLIARGYLHQLQALYKALMGEELKFVY